ncbi:DUF2256 domain-containing protein [Oleiagrimonas soli]|uniref:DUF2256 domain-containing protein n=2 Tax=Oleiagrimonas soli TaxID=1543381 RepID=UPI003CCD0F2F
MPRSGCVRSACMAFPHRGTVSAQRIANVRLFMHRKAHLPSKICPVCQRPFAWRKKWARVWDEVRYCSERCRRHAAAMRDMDRHR